MSAIQSLNLSQAEARTAADALMRLGGLAYRVAELTVPNDPARLGEVERVLAQAVAFGGAAATVRELRAIADRRTCPNCGGDARNDGSDYNDICTQWPRCGA
jgi:NADH pyrophosphatase NudC (nudix superfamily)